MADFIQSKVYLIHQTQAPKPTNDTKPTQPKTGGEITEEQSKPKAPQNNTNNGEVDDEAGAKRVVGSVSVKRRLTNLGVNTALSAATYVFQEQEFKQNYIGNSRGAMKIQQKKQIVAGTAQIVTSAASAGFTAAALGNPYILAIYAVGQVVELSNRVLTYVQELKQYNMERDKEIYESRYTRDRLVRDVYNRR